MEDGTTYDVRVYGTDVYKGAKVTTYRVRWKTGHRLWREGFRNAALADSFRSSLLTAARKGVLGNAHFILLRCDAGTAAPAWEGNSRGNPVMGHGHEAGQAPDQASRGWPGRCWQHRGHVRSKTRQQTVRHAKSHPAPPDTNLAGPALTHGRYPQAHTHRHAAGTRMVPEAAEKLCR
jgi:hypothetical protein